MAKYDITLNYLATYAVTVDAQDEGEAYDKARTMAENADMAEFQLGMEREASCECIGH